MFLSATGRVYSVLVISAVMLLSCITLGGNGILIVATMNILHWNIEHWWCSGGNSKVSDSNPIRAFLTRVLEFIGVGKGYGGGGGEQPSKN